MRQLHPVAAHERFLASGHYAFERDGESLGKRETWTMHQVNGGITARVDMDAREEEGKSLLLEALLDETGAMLRFDIRCESTADDSAIKHLSASYQFDGSRLGVGYRMGDMERAYLELELPAQVLIDMPILCLRGASLIKLARRQDDETPLFVPVFDHARLFPGIVSFASSPLHAMAEETLRVGGRELMTRRYSYRDKAASYWIDERGIIIKRVNAFKQREFVVTLHDYARKPG